MKAILLSIAFSVVISGCVYDKATVDDLTARLARAEQRIQQLEQSVKAAASGSWVLWVYSWPNGVALLPSKPPTIPEQAFDSKSECEAAANGRVRVGQDLVISHEPLKVQFVDRTTTFYCLPSNVKPQ